MSALQGSVVASIETQLHGYVVRETGVSCQKCVSEGPPTRQNQAEMDSEASRSGAFTIVVCSRNAYNRT